MPTFIQDQISFSYLEHGDGARVIFQHGMGGHAERLVHPLSNPEFRLLSFDFRGHGKTLGIGNENKLRFDTFADDVIAFMDFLGLEQAIVGGNSMGAGVSLNLALRYPERVKGLILLRPAWLDYPHPDNLEVFTTIITLIGQHSNQQGKMIFERSPLYQNIKQESEHAAATLLSEFDALTNPEQFAIRERFVSQAPVEKLELLQKINVPTLVMGQERDHTHPLAFAKTLASAIPNAQFKQLTSNAVNAEQYAKDLQKTINQFVNNVDE
jgi:pimeloyl-ACP methyl ester carboxylesterase